MKTKTYKFKESEKVSLFVLEYLMTIPTSRLKRIVRQYEHVSTTNCPWYVYRSTGIAGLAKEVIADRGWEKKNFPVAGKSKKAKP